MHVTWCGVHVLRVYGECVVVTIRCKLLQCFVHVYSVMYINGIWTWTYIYILWGERERECVCVCAREWLRKVSFTVSRGSAAK